MQLLAICTVESERLEVFERSLRFLNCRELCSHESLAHLHQLIFSDGSISKLANPVLAFRPGLHSLIYCPGARGPHQQHAHNWIAQRSGHPNEENVKWPSC